ncbi:hypothetical protein IGM_06508 [Bacillus cereus HuB4-4]|uniref:Uncharacterized protein n=1 Tax=Bacillus cereus HuB4-4 TaxID=1053211 RepID=A0A9W5QMY9_BACCE|nr:hypothetical protein [Bacillus cereus]EOP78901.1 hypothetical protein IGM_06508 [Bacillus cereus HuB4-4]
MKSKKFLTGTIVSSLLLLSASPALAASNANQVQNPTPNQSVHNQGEQEFNMKSTNLEEMENIAQKAEKYFVQNLDGTLSFTGTAEQLGTTPENLNQYLTGVEGINSAIRSGQVKVNANSNTGTLTVEPNNSAAAVKSGVSYASSSQDANGTTFYFNNAEAKKLSYELTKWSYIGAGVAAVAGFVAAFGIVPAAAAALAAGLISIGLAYIANEINYKTTNRGVKIYYSTWNMLKPVQVSGR